jgi:hypothetical protein
MAKRQKKVAAGMILVGVHNFSVSWYLKRLSIDEN